MQQNFISVPFKAESAHGLTNATGIAKFSAAGIVLEFESKIIGLISSGVKEVRLPLNEILDVKFRKGFMKRFARIEVRTTTVAKMTEIPNENGKITLKLDRDDFERGAEAVERLQRQMSGPAQIDQPDNMRPRSLFGTDEDDIETKEL
jgi:hypothetical protein